MCYISPITSPAFHSPLSLSLLQQYEGRSTLNKSNSDCTLGCVSIERLIRYYNWIFIKIELYCYPSMYTHTHTHTKLMTPKFRKMWIWLCMPCVAHLFVSFNWLNSFAATTMALNSFLFNSSASRSHFLSLSSIDTAASNFYCLTQQKNEWKNFFLLSLVSPLSLDFFLCVYMPMN